MIKTTKIASAIGLTTAIFFSSNAQVFKQDADNFTSGVYSREQLIEDWQTTSGNGFSRRGRGEDRVSVVPSSSPDTGNALKVKYPKGEADSKDSGAQWETDLKNGYEELYLSYDVKFSADFEFVKPGRNTGRTGKLPGLGGGLNFDDKDDRNTAWDGKLQFRDKDELEFYVKTPINNNKHFTWNKKRYTIAKNQWFNIEIRYKLNTVGRKNGIMQAWVDGELFGEYTNAEFRDNANVKINKMFFSTFYGGNVEADAPTKDVYAYFDNFIVDTKKINKTVGQSTGNTSNSNDSNTVSNSRNNTSNNTSNNSNNVAVTPATTSNSTNATNDSENTNTCRGSSPKSISRKIQAESYCKGKEVTKRSTYVTSIDQNNFMEYFVNIPETTDYVVKYRIASNKNSGRGKIRLRLSGTNKGDISVPKTGGATRWRTIKKTMRLEKGNRTIRIQAIGGGGWNFDHFEIKKENSSKELLPSVSEVQELVIYPNPSSTGYFNLSEISDWQIWNIAGNLIATGKGNRIDLSNHAKGLYLLKTVNGIKKIIVE